MEGFRILVVDDEPVQREMIAEFLARAEFDVQAVSSGAEALAVIKKERVDLVITDYKMPGMSGLELVKESKEINPEVNVVILTAYGTIGTAVAAMKEGAYDYLTKPVDLDELLALIARVKERNQLLAENKELKHQLRDRHQFDHLVAESGPMQEVLSMAARVADSDATVLIRGESGTGKELLARAIHYHSPRCNYPLVKVNCAALPETLLESELFGHEKGAFTGASYRRIGRFEAAQKGTIFLDEIGDLSLALQVKLLRVLQEKEFERLGSNTTLKADVRIIAATNTDLEQAVKEKTFREDIYYRLNVVTVLIPPLRERRADIPALLDHFLARFAKEYNKEVSGFTPQAKDLLVKYDYPGNVRELENMLARATLLTRTSLITEEALPKQLGSDKKPVRLADQPGLPETIAGLESQMIAAALEKHDGVQTRAAGELGISERVLRYKLKKYGLSWPEKSID
ncbi:MAG: sigma-54 dependent transcriptional regulator [Thermodesulfobacteriota bacterium]